MDKQTAYIIKLRKEAGKWRRRLREAEESLRVLKLATHFPFSEMSQADILVFKETMKRIIKEKPGLFKKDV